MSKNYERVKKWYNLGKWPKEAVRNAVVKNGLLSRSTKKSPEKNMTTAEIIEIQDEIINKQEFMIRQMALQLKISEIWSEEAKRIQKLKNRLEGNDGYNTAL